MADEPAVGVMLAKTDIAGGGDHQRTAVIHHALHRLQMLADAFDPAQTVAFDLTVEPVHGFEPEPPFFVGMVIADGDLAVKQMMGVDREPLFAAKACGQFVHQKHQIFSIVQIQIQPDAGGESCLQQPPDRFHDHLIGTLAVPIDECLAAVVDFLGAVQRDLDRLQIPEVLRLMNGLVIKQIAIGGDSGMKVNACFTQVLTDDVHGLLIEQRLAAKPRDANLLTAAMLPDVPGGLVGGLLAHGDPGAALFKAVKTPGVAVGGGHDDVVIGVFGLLCGAAKYPPDHIGLFHFVHLFRNHKPAVFQLLQLQNVCILLVAEQNQLPGQDVKQQNAFVHLRRNTIFDQTASVPGTHRLSQNCHHFMIRFRNDFQVCILPVVYQDPPG